MLSVNCSYPGASVSLLVASPLLASLFSKEMDEVDEEESCDSFELELLSSSDDELLEPPEETTAVVVGAFCSAILPGFPKTNKQVI